MKKALKYIGIGLLALVIIASASAYFGRTKIIKHFIPEVEQSGDIQITVKDDTSYISTKLIVRNKAFFQIKIDTIKYNICVFGVECLKSIEHLGLVLPSYGSDSINFSVAIPHKSLIKNIRKERKKGDSASYSLNVALQYSTKFWKAEMPIEKSGIFKLPTPPEIKIESIKWKKVKLKSIFVDVKIRIINHTPVAVAIKNVNYTFGVIDRGSIEGSYLQPIIIKPHETTFVNIPLEIKTERIGKILVEVLRDKDQYQYKLTLNAKLESTEPTKKIFVLDLTNTGEMELKK